MAKTTKATKVITEAISQEHLSWALQVLKECECEVLKIELHPKKSFFRNITFAMPIVA